MNQREIESQLFKWLVEFVEVSNDKLNGWPPCPFAKQARLKENIKILFDDIKLDVTVEQAIPLLNEKEVVIICFDHKFYNADFIQQYGKDLNIKLKLQDIVVLEDHPDNEEYINNIKMNFGLCGLLVLQKLSLLNLHSQKLQEKGYYNVWSESELQDVVNWRFK